MKKIFRYSRWVFAFIIISFIIDRIFFMDGRVAGVWMYQSGDFMGDPIALKQDFEMKGSMLEFYNGEIFYIVGCYSNQLLLYSTKSKRLTRYSYDR